MEFASTTPPPFDMFKTGRCARHKHGCPDITLAQHLRYIQHCSVYNAQCSRIVQEVLSSSESQCTRDNDKDSAVLSVFFLEDGCT